MVYLQYLSQGPCSDCPLLLPDLYLVSDIRYSTRTAW
jgi:hypothetical protein